MSDQRFIVAFEIGSSKIKGAVGAVDQTGTLSVLAIEEEPLVDAVRYGCIRKVQEVSDRIQSVTRKLDNYAAVSPGHICGAYVSLGGQSLMSTSTNIEKKFAEDTEITDALIKQLKEQARAAGIPDRDIVAVLTRDFTVDTLPQKNPVGFFCHEFKAGVTMLSCRPQLKSNLNRVFSERLPLNINGYIIRPLATASIVLTEDEKHLGCMLVDFGAETTTVAIYKNGGLRYLATIPMGSRNITRDLTALNCLEKRAEEIKKVIGNVNPQQQFDTPATFEGLDNTEINNYIQARAGEIITNIIEQPVYAGLKPEDLPAGIVIVGGGAKLRGFIDLLTSHSKMKVRRGNPTGAIRISDQRLSATDNIDVISLLAIAAKLPLKTCIEFPVQTGGTIDNGDDDNISRVGADMNDDFNEEDEDDPHAIKTKKPTPSKAKGKSFLERMKEKVMGILDENNDDHFNDSEDELKH